MKTFRFIGMALIAVFMCVNFTACSDDDGGNGGGDNKRRIKKVVMTDSYGTKKEVAYTYDREGELITAIETIDAGEWKYSDGYHYYWADGSIIITLESWDEHNGNISNVQEHRSTLTLENGLVQSIKDDHYTRPITYNKDRIAEISIAPFGNVLTRLQWDNDKLLYTQSYDRDIYLTYGTTCNKGYFPMMCYFIDGTANEALFNAHPELIGAYSTKLPTKMKSTSDKWELENYTQDISYAFDNDGYISKATAVTDDGKTTTMIFTWE